MGSESYTVILLLPADLPQLSYVVLRHMQSLDWTHCREILIVPDQPTDLNLSEFHFDVPVRILKRSWLQTFVVKTQSPYKMFFAQFLNGIKHAQSEWALIKGANTLVNDSQAYARYFTQVNGTKAYIAGLRVRQDIDRRFIGTCEMLFRPESIRRIVPYRLWRPLERNGVQYDNMMYPQKVLIDRGEEDRLYPYALAHTRISYCVGSYREIRKHHLTNDMNLRLWFLILLNDLLPSPTYRSGDLPRLEEYYALFTQKLNPIYRESMEEFFESVRSMAQTGGLELGRVEQEIETIKKKMIFAER